MSDRERDSGAARDEAGPGRGAAGGIATGVLLGTVACVLVAGLALRTTPPRSQPRPGGDAPSVPVPPRPAARPPLERPAPAARPSPAPPAPAAADDDDLRRRATQDGARLGRSSGEFTAQVLLACSPENVRRLLRGAGAGPLYLLRAPERGEGCYRICWGSYAPARQAAAAADLPGPLRPSAGSPVPKRIAEVVR